MTKFTRTEIAEFYAFQFNFEGTEQQRDAFEGNSRAAELGYEGAVKDVFRGSAFDVRVSLEGRSSTSDYSSGAVLSVNLGWVYGDAEIKFQKTLTLREGDWLVAEHPIYRVLTNEEFLKLQAVAA